MNKIKQNMFNDFARERNLEKALFTAGPASLLAENLSGLRPCFGRGDSDYEQVEASVLNALKKISGHQYVVQMQGSGSLALEIAMLNFISGRVLVISTGHYSNRLHMLAESVARHRDIISHVDIVDWQNLDGVRGKYDWVISCVTETSRGLLIPIDVIANLARRLSARLMLDAIASIGLESDHQLADVIAYSSCKGLFGLTGGAFVAFNERPKNLVDSFYLNLDTHLNRQVTGPYHAIASLYEVLPRHEDFVFAVRENKRLFLEKMNIQLTLPIKHQPMLCTHVRCEVISRDPRAVLYKPRGDILGSVVCHLGEAHLGRAARGQILELLEIKR